MARSRIAATLLWGPDFVLLYNEPYLPILAREVFPEVWPGALDGHDRSLGTLTPNEYERLHTTLSVA